MFGKLVAGDDVLTRMEQVETTRNGIFVMPKDRIDIVSTYVYTVGSGGDTAGGDAENAGAGASAMAKLRASLEECKAQVQGLRLDLQSMRSARLP